MRKIDERVLKYIRNVKTWKELNQLDENLGIKGKHGAITIEALEIRSTEIGISEALNYLALNLEELDEVNKRIIKVIGHYQSIKRRSGSHASYTSSR